jgi:hypothetical protein
MYQLLITTLEQKKGAPKVEAVRHPVNTVVASFLSEELREQAVEKLERFNEARRAPEMKGIIDHVSYMYVRL